LAQYLLYNVIGCNTYTLYVWWIPQAGTWYNFKILSDLFAVNDEYVFLRSNIIYWLSPKWFKVYKLWKLENIGGYYTTTNGYLTNENNFLWYYYDSEVIYWKTPSKIEIINCKI